MNIIPKLQMNLHPKDATNLSLATAKNVMLANDESCLVNEEGIRENTVIHNALFARYNNSYDFKVVGVIPCNAELVIITIANASSTDAQIFRYQEATATQTEKIECVYDKFKYHGGKIKGAFTYNVENSLVVAIAEYDCPGGTKVPLRTINLGNFDDETIYSDREIPDNALSVAPELYIPSMTHVRYVKGNAYKGWYYLFVRFKINSVDYTQWFNFGHPIYVDTLEQYAITKYCYRQKVTGFAADDAAFGIVLPEDPEDGYCVGASDYFSSSSDIANETFKIDIKFDERDKIYKKYQIGIACASKSYTKAFRTADIDFEANSTFTLNNANLIDASVEEFIIDNFNYYDVHNVINYQNRLYIANYKENNANNDDIVKSGALNNIRVELLKSGVTGSKNSYDCTIVSDKEIGYHNNQYDGNGYVGIDGDDYFNVPEDYIIQMASNNGQTIGTVIDNSNGKMYKAKDVKILTNGSGIEFNDGAYTITSATLGTIMIVCFEADHKGATIYKGETKLFIKKDENDPGSTVTIDTTKYAINGGVNYTNVNSSFENRKLTRFLIPGEVYNFFIHFVDKYGHCTNGYRIENRTEWTGANNSGEIVPVPFTHDGKTYYAGVPIDMDVAKDGKLNNLGDIPVYTTVSGTHLTNTDNSKEVRDAFAGAFSSFGDSKYENVKWYQISTGYGFEEFLPYYNNNGDKLFKVPLYENPYSYHVYATFDISVKGVTVPEGYVGWFLSYEKFEPTKRVTGMLTRNDFRSQDYVQTKSKNTVLNTANCHKSDLMYFYSGQYDISDSIRLDYNVMRIDGVNVWDTDDIPEYDYAQRCGAYKFCHDMNKPQDQPDMMDVPACYAPSEYKLAIADSAADGRMGLGTALQMKDAYGLFDDYNPGEAEYKHGRIKLYKVTFLNADRNIYMSDNKTLVRFTDVIYDSLMYSSLKSYSGLNGVMTYDGCLVYSCDGFTFNTGNNIAYRTQQNTKYYETEADRKYRWEIAAPFLAYLQFPCFDDHFYESKCFNNAPAPYVFYVKQDTEDLDKANENNKFANGCIVTPANSVDLFQNKQGSSDMFNVKTFTNYREDLVSVDAFDKTVRRSNVIQDETRNNGWRNFPVEAYKNITENKGMITNLVGIGTMLLVHTQHSLFMFSTDNMLATKDKDIQLSQPDAFEVNYKEVFTSSLGYGGLQDDKAFIVDQFGYIFYNDDFRRLYRFDNGQLALIDDDIVEWLRRYSPYGVRFGNDKGNNRILIKMNYMLGSKEKSVTLSYNYAVKNFVSVHSYGFDEAYDTKSKLYLQCNDTIHKGCSFHQFVKSDKLHGDYDNVIGESSKYPSSIGIIVNEQYAAVKFLEFISYKLNKLSINDGDDPDDYTCVPVGKRWEPYSGDFIRVYNDQTDTGTLDVLINEEEKKNIFVNYKKPYWELGNWNFSYLRNNVSLYSKYGDAFDMSRIFGNYFVVEFTFLNTDGRKVEFETLNYNITK